MLLSRLHLHAVLRPIISLIVLSVTLSIGPQFVPTPAAAAPTADDDDQIADAFLNRLLDEINGRRQQLGTQPLAYVPASVNSALDGYLAAVTPAIAWPGPCEHLTLDGAYSWDFVLAAGFGGEPRGEVIACPGPEPYWTPDLTAGQWWDSPVHFDVLYADPDANVLACSTYGRDSAGLGGHESADVRPATLVGLPGQTVLAQLNAAPLTRNGETVFARDKRKNDNGNGNWNGNGNDNDRRRQPRTSAPPRQVAPAPSVPASSRSSDAALAVLCVTLRG